MRLGCQESRALADYARTSIDALNICFLQSPLDRNTHKQRKGICRAVADRDLCYPPSKIASTFSAIYCRKGALLLPALHVQGRASASRCPATPESNGTWTTKDRLARPGYSSHGQWNGRDSWSVHKPLQVPLEDAIHQGNWLEARGLAEKLLSVGPVQDISSLEKLIKGELSRSRMPTCCNLEKEAIFDA